ncbi:glycoside hydrolase family 15 protein [Mangrovibacterium diazotrophicum]|uniref:GH15 family glucan-1,4-alpha-glucosidase n=1 Tax=Mangrovibacterium diazotrophicum TaxID=1261403 RepID=A0A419VWX2_9BACT|nr:glycoside hydrolase family 15 protein [Mangrovibacterium diazotrophicum]RKD87733.1 GH15 family glucan-1,4-alpha-glucosidase [Mangrovibacterium diazotrophicum]
MDTLDYGIVGNCRSAALISKDGAIEWLCLPQFNSSSVFASILDKEKGGIFSVTPKYLERTTQHYIPRTNILVTRFHCLDGVFEVHDFMPRYRIDKNDVYYTPPDLVRYFKHIVGDPEITLLYKPKLEYGIPETKNVIEHDYIKASTVKGPYDSLYMYSSIDLTAFDGSKTVKLMNDEFCLISYNQKLLHQDVRRSMLKLERTKVYWLNWAERTTSFKVFQEEIIRSALTLKMLSFDKSGAILAALTTSLPETIGEERNWDYRFCWIRDASMVVKIMTSLGHTRMARHYLNFIIDILPEKDEKMQIMYGIRGEKKLTEQTLGHLSGYENSYPVRIGNAAYKQKQNDIYGILLDVIYQHFELYTTSLEHSEELWTIVRNVIKVVANNWQKPDRGIWEIRSENKHFTFSKVLCWAAVDRAVKIAGLLKRDMYVEKWSKLRDKIDEDIHKNAWSETKQAFTQAYGSEDLDASVLLMESYGFISATDQRFVNTVLAIQKELEHNGLMFRYRNQDDFGTPKSAFTICSFWLINSLYKIGRKKEAIHKFKTLISYSNHLGLFSEDLDFETKRMLGNFPQAYSHLALIETAITISDSEITDEEEIMEFIN